MMVSRRVLLRDGGLALLSFGFAPGFQRFLVTEEEPFTPQNGQLTGTGRPKRDAIIARYQSHFMNATGDRPHGIL